MQTGDGFNVFVDNRITMAASDKAGTFQQVIHKVKAGLLDALVRLASCESSFLNINMQKCMSEICELQTADTTSALADP